ncbi:MAG: MFS transporter [Sphingomonas sp.]|uniref:MFS transporter n=1 Tax=Sphingomonas sp. TaxID=28214 RepID=UPI00121C6086|nr:MFS transporter [Sphingomonas sp.]THD35283.1 MAG: MFS transporter [Sphingomonas sp.]
MLNALGLMKQRRFLPLFVTQFLGAFNDNLFKQAMVLVVVYQIYNDPAAEQSFNGIASALSIIAFVLLSALAGQLADAFDKTRIIRIVKTAEIAIMVVGGAGLLLAKGGHTHIGLVLMLGTIFALGVHSTFFGPIKYAILPQHLKEDEVLGGTGLVESATYIAILLGTVLAGFMKVEHAVIGTLVVAGIGWLAARRIPPAPRQGPKLKINYNPFTSSWRLISGTMHIPRLFLAICAISFFWTMGIVLIVIFTPLAKNVLTADKHVATLLTALFSVGIAIGSVAINSLLKGHTSAKFGPATVLVMGGFVILFSILCQAWPAAPVGHLYTTSEFIAVPFAWLVVAALVGIAIFGGMFVVPLYAFLTTTVHPDETSRTVAANNVVNSGAMAVGSVIVSLLTAWGVGSAQMLYLVALMCPVSAWLAWKLHKACD